MMELSELMDRLASKGVKLSLKPNYKKYYNKFPHIVRFSYTHDRNYQEIGLLRNTIYKKIRENVESDDYRTRNEYYDLNIYCLDPVKILNALPIATLKKWVAIRVEVMADIVAEETSIKPELPRAKTVVVKKLPWNEYRYRVYWPNNHRTFNKIDLQSVAAIVDQINSDAKTRKLDDYTTSRLKQGRYWGASYFHTNSEDLFCIISLINPLFIKKIEKFTTLEELNEKATSGSTN